MRKDQKNRWRNILQKFHNFEIYTLAQFHSLEKYYLIAVFKVFQELNSMRILNKIMYGSIHFEARKKFKPYPVNSMKCSMVTMAWTNLSPLTRCHHSLDVVNSTLVILIYERILLLILCANKIKLTNKKLSPIERIFRFFYWLNWYFDK